MAKKDKKKKSKKDQSGPVEAVGAVRSAVERTFQATAEGAQTTRERAAELVDDVAGAAAGRVRGVIEDQLKGMRREVEALSRRVAELEKSRRGTSTASARKPAARKTTAARKPASTRSASTARKPASTRSASTARKPAAKRSTSASTGAKKRTASSSRSSGSRSSGGSSSARKSS